MMNDETHSAMTSTPDNASAATCTMTGGRTLTQVKPLLKLPEGVTITAVGILHDDTEVTPKKYNRVFNVIKALGRASNWLLGDTLDLADRTWGNSTTGSKYAEASKATGLSINTLRHIASVCHRIPIEERHPELSFGHHQEALFGTDSWAECKAALERAETERLSIRAFRKDLLERRAAAKAETDASTDAGTQH